MDDLEQRVVAPPKRRSQLPERVVGLAQQGYYKNWGSQSLTAPRISWPKRIVQQVGELYQEYF